MNLKAGWGLKYLLLLLPRYKSHINVRTGKVNIAHISKSRVGIVNLVTSATTPNVSHKGSKM